MTKKSGGIIQKLELFFLRKYDKEEYILYQKAQICLYLTILVVLTLVFELVYTIIIRDIFSPHIIYPEVIGLFVIFFNLLILRRGNYSLSSHMLLILSMSTTWTIIFFDNSAPVARLDTIAFILSLVALSALLMHGRKYSVFFYAFLNIAMMIIFVFFNYDFLDTTSIAKIDWIVDSSLATIFIAIIGYNIFIINQRALSRTEDELQQRLAAEDSLNIKNIELKASVEELKEVNEKNEAQNKELIRTQVELQKSEEEYRAIFNSANDAILYLEKFQIKNCNKVSYSFFQTDVLEGKSILDFSLPFQPDNLPSKVKAEKYYQALMDGKTPQFYWQFITEKGVIFDTNISLSIIKLENIPYVLTIIRNITEIKKLEKQLIQAQKMEAMGTLTSGLAHDFNNILGGIMGGADLISLYIEDSDFNEKDEVEKYINTIIKSSRRASEMIGQLMSLTRNQKTAFEPVDINQSIDNIIQILQNSFPKSITIKYQKYEKSPIIYAEETQLEQVMLNLCINASHAMTIMRPDEEKEGGILNISIDYILSSKEHATLDPDADSDTNYFVIKVTDTGIGMNEEVRSQLFNPFFTTKAKGTGTGLGLSMVYNIIKNHSGFITVYSQPGLGSTFNVYLPEMTDVDNKNLHESIEENIQYGSGTILIIDDETIQQTIMEGMLRECGYQVILSSGEKRGFIFTGKILRK